MATIFLFQQSAVAKEKSEAKIAPSAQENVEKNVPRIDDEAASIVRKPKKVSPVHYSLNFWTFILGSYVFLLIFNLSFDFEKKKGIQWFWEAAFTFVAIFTWDKLDVLRENRWFPGVLMEIGVIIYLFYFYFMRNKLKSGTSADDFDDLPKM